MSSILFVDDEPNVLGGLRNALRSRRGEWDMVFACGGQAALSQLEERTFDVVVSDMRMPHLDGASLLARVKEMQPRALRMILSGETGADAAMRSVFLAHRFLSKPCDSQHLQTVLDRACRLSELMGDERLRAAAGSVATLPPVPRTFLALSRLLADPKTTMKDVTAVVERDAALCAKILQLVNSAFFGLSRRVASVADAVTTLGTATIKNLALAVEACGAVSALPAAETAAIQRHSFQVADLARQIWNGSRDQADEAFVAGVLHDIGRLMSVAPPPGSESAGDEHAGLGAYLLALWGLPHSIIEAVAFHDAPAQLAHQGLELVDVVRIADRLAAEAGRGCDPEPLDRDYLASRGIGEAQLDGWRGLAAKAAGTDLMS